MKRMEVWAGLECTRNRVGEKYYDQCEKNRHYQRPSDFDLFADLGVEKIRYPCLWERVSPKNCLERDWSILDYSLEELRRKQITIVAGFLHHGSGPVYTDLMDPKMPEMLAVYARDFAIRYPWVTDYTPINEILTTTRFSFLYGHWYPHHKNVKTFFKALFNQCKATVMVMREIKRIIPHAKLIQTEDMGKCQSTPPLQYQCDFENERRWLSYDILCGKFDSFHPLYNWAISEGASKEDIEWSRENFYAPDVLGINHYQLSNRFLDHRKELYPEEFHGGNGIDTYADVGAIDTGAADLPDPKEILLEAWNRFLIPIAITEAHARGSREEQMRWFYQMWKAANEAKDAGAEIIAITAWSLLGTYDWNTLCTQDKYFYEPGVYDLRSVTGMPRPTALRSLIHSLATNGKANIPLLEINGIWKSPRRILFAPQPGAHSMLSSEGRPLVITGATGTLGKALAKICRERNMHYVILTRNEMDITDLNSVRTVLDEVKPWAVVNAAGYVKVDEAEYEKEQCYMCNVVGPTNIAMACRELKIPMLTFSSDLVFNGEQSVPYNEENIPAPLNTYGHSKAFCEEKVLAVYPEALIIRSSAFFGPWDEYNFVSQTLEKIKNRKEIIVANDCKVTPTYLPDLANAALDLLVDGASGVYHLTNKGEVTWAELAHTIAAKARDHFQFETPMITEKSMEEITLARRPKYSCLTSIKGFELPTLEDAIGRYFSQL
jgi:dTDP-4-dehydrorhamnose reductase